MLFYADIVFCKGQALSVSKKRIIGIDPGSLKLGYAIIDAIPFSTQMSIVSMGVISMNSKFTFEKRLLQIGEEMNRLLQQYQPSVASVEKIFLGKNTDSAFKLGHARGVAVYECVKNGLSLREYATKTIKKGIAGSGSADKLMVQNSLESLMKIKIKSSGFDATDALALAVYHAFYAVDEKFLQRMVEA